MRCCLCNLFSKVLFLTDVNVKRIWYLFTNKYFVDGMMDNEFIFNMFQFWGSQNVKLLWLIISVSTRWLLIELISSAFIY